jgi:hypothetical protein
MSLAAPDRFQFAAVTAITAVKIATAVTAVKIATTVRPGSVWRP